MACLHNMHTIAISLRIKIETTIIITIQHKDQQYNLTHACVPAIITALAIVMATVCGCISKKTDYLNVVIYLAHYHPEEVRHPCAFLVIALDVQIYMGAWA